MCFLLFFNQSIVITSHKVQNNCFKSVLLDTIDLYTNVLYYYYYYIFAIFILSYFIYDWNLFCDVELFRSFFNTRKRKKYIDKRLSSNNKKNGFKMKQKKKKYKQRNEKISIKSILIQFFFILQLLLLFETKLLKKCREFRLIEIVLRLIQFPAKYV